MNSEVAAIDWTQFLDNYWGKAPVAFKGKHDKAYFSESDLISSAYEKGQNWLAGYCKRPVFFLNGKNPGAKIVNYLPQSEDSNFSKYHQRLKETSNNAEFMLYAQDIQQFNYSISKKTQEFIKPIIKHHGFQSYRIDTSVILGNYAFLPLSLHKHSNEHFLFGIKNTRKLFLWPSDFFDEKKVHLYREDPTPFKDQAEQFLIEPGDILYWPPNYWHDSECPDGFAVTANISIWRSTSKSSLFNTCLYGGKHLQRVTQSLVNQMIDAEQKVTINPTGQINLIPYPQLTWVKYFTDFKKVITDSAMPFSSLCLYWLKGLSNNGVNPPTLPRKNTHINLNQTLQLINEAILWVEFEEQIIWAINGLGGTAEKSTNAHLLFSKINSNSNLKIDQLLDDVSARQPIIKNNLIELIKLLYCYRAIEVI